MSESNLDDHVKTYYQSKQLSEPILADLVAMYETHDRQQLDQQQSRRWFWQRNIAIAATLLVCLVSVGQFMQPATLLTDKLAMLVSKEIALNHNKRLAPEFVADDYTLLNKKMDKLDFNLLAPNRIQGSKLKLVGARYCSIHGQLATQLKLVDDKGVLHTLYQTQLNDELSRLPEDTYLVNGVKVEQWQEGGLFFGFAESL